MASKKSPRKNEQKTSRPFTPVKITLGSHQAQVVFNRTFAILSNSLHQLSVILPIVTKDQKEAEQVISVVDEILATVQQEVKAEKERLKHLCEQEGISSAAQFQGAKEVVAEITSPRAGKYLHLIRGIDDIIAHLSALWLSGILDDPQYNQTAFSWQRRLQKTSSKVNEITKRAMGAANRKETAEKQDPEKPAVNEDIGDSSADSKIEQKKDPGTEDVSAKKPQEDGVDITEEDSEAFGEVAAAGA